MNATSIILDYLLIFIAVSFMIVSISFALKAVWSLRGEMKDLLREQAKQDHYDAKREKKNLEKDGLTLKY